MLVPLPEPVRTSFLMAEIAAGEIAMFAGYRKQAAQCCAASELG